MNLKDFRTIVIDEYVVEKELIRIQGSGFVKQLVVINFSYSSYYDVVVDGVSMKVRNPYMATGEVDSKNMYVLHDFKFEKSLIVKYVSSTQMRVNAYVLYKLGGE